MPNNRQRLKILHVIPSVAACRGGPSKAVIEMVRSLNDIGHNAEIATTNDNGPDELNVTLGTLIEHKGAPTRFFKRFSPNLSAAREFAYSSSFTHWLSSNITHYDVIHVHAIFSYCSSYAMYLARKKAMPYIVRPIGQLQHWSLEQSSLKKTIYLKLIERRNIESASKVHFTAESESQEARQRFTLQGTVIPLGIHPPLKARFSKSELMRRYSVKSSKFTLLYLSRLHQKKGLELLLHALSRSTNTDYTLLIAGDGEPNYKDDLTSLVSTLKIGDRCHFLGHVDGDEKVALLTHSDLYALTSYSENFGISVIEAMSYGLTPLVSKEVALAQVVNDHKLGFVCRTDVDDIRVTLERIFDNQKDLTSLGTKAQQYTSNHLGWPNIARELTSLYESLI